ncbi:MAG: CTP synthase [Dehalococcoidales bacterium]|nr:CTP synthase [Dehalococcoidales bacterium]
MSKYIFVTGGVVSSVGKGITVASLGTILKSRNISVSLMKLDPYLNVDPGTMSPYQHGEVFVTQDGAETDLDLGNYERFVDINLTAQSNVTSGKIYSSVIARERRGDFLGGTIQIIPHLTNEIKQRFTTLAETSGADVLIIEIGGTVGDIEGQPFLEAIRQMRNDVGRDNVLYIHVTLLPYLGTTHELKTKPTQHSVNELRRIGIQPDIIVCRSDFPISDDIRAKISLFCDVEKRAVIPMPTIDSIYEVPLLIEEAKMGELISEKLKLESDNCDLTEWRGLVQSLKEPKPPVKIALVGKYVELHDAYYSVREALCHAGVIHNRSIEFVWVHSESLRQDDCSQLNDVQGIIVPGGFGIRGIEGMIAAAQYAREHNIPYFGLCLGMQVMVIEFARYVLKTADANSTEFAPDTRHPVIDLMPDQSHLLDKGATMRLGNYPCRIKENTLSYQAYGTSLIQERHRHRYEFNNSYREQLEAAGLILSGLSPDGNLVEICEVKNHPWMVGSQFHPEFGSRPGRPHPLFCDFIGAAKTVLREGAQSTLPLNAGS